MYAICYLDWRQLSQNLYLLGVPNGLFMCWLDWLKLSNLHWSSSLKFWLCQFEENDKASSSPVKSTFARLSVEAVIRFWFKMTDICRYNNGCWGHNRIQGKKKQISPRHCRIHHINIMIKLTWHVDWAMIPISSYSRYTPEHKVLFSVFLKLAGTDNLEFPTECVNEIEVNKSWILHEIH